MGNRPIPLATKLKTGNPGKKKLNMNEPTAERGIPDIPEWLKSFPLAVSEWEREASVLDNMGIMTVAEEGILATRCYMASQIQEMALDIKKEGRTVQIMKMDSLGNEIFEVKPNPKCLQLKNLITEYRQTGSLLGLDPASRTKLSADPGSKRKGKYDGYLGAVGGKK